MKIDKEDKDWYKKWKIDYVGTITANFVGIIFYVFLFIYLFKMLSFIASLNDELKLISLIVFLFTLPQMIKKIGFQHIEFKARKP